MHQNCRLTGHRHKALLLAAVLATIAGSLSATEDTGVTRLAANYPECFHVGFKYTPLLEGSGRKADSLQQCQTQCRQLPGCRVFAYFPSSGECQFGDWEARMVESSEGAVAGHSVCPEPTQTPPGRCRTEVPHDGFPGRYFNSSNRAWPSGRQPWSLECWPRNWTGGYLSCQKVEVLADTRSGWPGKCSGLAKQRSSLAYTPMDPGSNDSCEQDCVQNPLCASWQLGQFNECWQGVGRDCFVRENFSPQTAQRLQHGEVRKLMDLAGWQVVGLYKSFSNEDGFFGRTHDAVRACKDVCYSDIRCQFWQYSPRYGCYVEDPSQGFSPGYPLTLDWAYRSTSFALDCVAGEFIQHYCPDHLTTAYPTEAPQATIGCMRRGVRQSPLDMAFQTRTVEMNAVACQLRCQNTHGCRHFAYWPDGGCHLQDSSAEEVVAESEHVISGPPSCEEREETSEASAPRSAKNSTTAWETIGFTKEGEQALSGGQLPAPSPNPRPSPLPELQQPLGSAVTGGRVAQIRVLIENLELPSTTTLERQQLQTHFLDALSRALGLPLSALQAEPGGQRGLVQLEAEPPGASALVAYTPAPLEEEELHRLQVSLESPGFSNSLKTAVFTVLGSSHSAIRGSLAVTDPTARSILVQATTTGPSADARCNFLCRHWPVIVGCIGLACFAGLLAGFLLFKKPPSKRGKAAKLLASDLELSSTYEQSEFDSHLTDDASVWASEPSWDSPVRSNSEWDLRDTYSSRRGETIFEA